MNTRLLSTLPGYGGSLREKAVAFRRNPGQYDTRRALRAPTISRLTGRNNHHEHEYRHEHNHQEGAMS